MWYPIEKTVKTWVLRRLERRMPRRCLTPVEVDWTAIRRILIVRQHDQFGDFLLTTPAIRALRDRFPDARITLVVRPYLAPVAQGNPHVDEVLVFHGTGWRQSLRASLDFVRQVRWRFDLAVVFNTVSHSLSSDLIAWLSRAPLVLGPETPTFDHCERNPFYNLVAPVAPAPKHQIHRNLDVTRYLGADTDDMSYGFGLTPEEEQSGARLVRELAGTEGKRIFGVHFGTKDVRKRYPIPALAELCDRITARGDTRILVIKSPDENELLTELQSLVRLPVMVAPFLALREVAALIRSLDLLICNDTGVLHLAAAVGTPTVSFHALSDPAIWKPIGTRHVALYATDGDIAAIPVERAVEAVERAAQPADAHQDGVEDAIIRCG